MLAGRRTDDALADAAQAVGRATWDERIEHTSSFINADLIAARVWPGAQMRQAHDTSRLAADAHDRVFTS